MRNVWTWVASAGAVCLIAATCVKRAEDTSEKARPKKTRAAIEKLDALSYVDGTIDLDPRSGGETLSGAPFDGYNFYSSRKESAAELLDLRDNVVHRWATRERGGWQHVTLFPNGDILVLVKDERIVKYDVDSNELWRHEGRVHHDLWVHTDGRIYSVSRETVRDGRLGPLPSIVDTLTVLSADGQILETIDLLAALERSPYGFVVQRPPAVGMFRDHRANDRINLGEFDVTHVNHVEVFDGRLAHLDPLYAAGNLLVSYRNTNAVAILEAETHDVLWLWGPNNLVFQHHPSLVDNGNILIFNNGTKRSGSQLLEVDPRTNRIMWSYVKKDFYSRARGSAQRLPNGNTLVTESDTGEVFEITRAGTRVWEFRNPHWQQRTRMAIWRMLRFPKETLRFPFNGGVVGRQP